MPLTQDQVAIIKATIPILKEGGVALTAKMYSNMLAATPSVRPMFNPAHQASGLQPKALAHSLLLYAKYIDDLDQLSDLIERIVSKHITLQVLPAHYDIVGHFLIAAMKEVLGDVATQDVLDAWAAAYLDLANLLIGLEEKREQAGEWRGYREFTVQNKVQESNDVVSVYLTPKDGKPATSGRPGQYIGIKFNDAAAFTDFEGSIRREYSLSDVPTGQTYRISVKRIPGGVASGYIHDTLSVGDTVEVAPPTGGLLYEPSGGQKEVLLLAGGIGITPLLSIAKQIIKSSPEVKVTLVNTVKGPDSQPFVKELADITSKSNGQFSFVSNYSRSDPATVSVPSFGGHLVQADLDRLLVSKQDTLVYYLGPMKYMISVANYLQDLGVPEKNTRREFFCPDQSIVVDAAK